MLKITSLLDLKKYYETRREMARAQVSIYPRVDSAGMVYAWDEAIKALDALIEFESQPRVELTNQ